MKNITLQDIWKDRSFRISIIMTLLFLTVGFAFLHLGLATYGWAVFIILPIVLGLAIGALDNRAGKIVGLLTGLAVFLVVLILMGLEGFVCILICLPLIIPFIFIGAIISKLARRIRSMKDDLRINVLVLPLVIFMIIAPAEQLLTSNSEEIREVSTEIILPFSPEEVFDAVKSIDKVTGDKPFLMKLDLPIPQKCVLEHEEVGATRICYFEDGRIVQRITAFERGKILSMDIVSYELTGRDWLKFVDADYLFEPTADGGCKLTRITRYKSNLSPSLYWESFEILGIEQEHDYVFSHLSKDLEARSQTQN